MIVVDIQFAGEYADPTAAVLAEIREQSPVFAGKLDRWIELEQGEEAAYDVA